MGAKQISACAFFNSRHWGEGKSAQATTSTSISISTIAQRPWTLILFEHKGKTNSQREGEEREPIVSVGRSFTGIFGFNFCMQHVHPKQTSETKKKQEQR
jgi:hypothetical protein